MNNSETKYCYVVFSDDWGRHPSSCQHLFKKIMGHSDVIWVNTIGLRTPRLTWYDMKRTFQVMSNWFFISDQKKGKRNESALEKSPTVISPFMLPFLKWHWVQHFNNFFISWALNKAFAKQKGNQKRILVSTIPIIPKIFKMKAFYKRVYYCVDDFSLWHGVDGEIMRKSELELLPHCDNLIAVSDELFEARKNSVPSCHLLTHGVDVAHFSNTSLTKPEDLKAYTGRILGCFGLFDERIDGRLLIQIAEKFPEHHIVIIGPIDRSLEQFKSCSNLHFLGPKPYSKLPNYAGFFDICILPYKINDETHNINPLKLKEYLATGKPVLTTPLREAIKLQPYCFVADRDSFCSVVSEVLYYGRKNQRYDALSFLKKEDWSYKAEQFVKIVQA